MDATFFLDHAVFNYRVAAVFIVDDFILIHKQKGDDHWGLPGGRVTVLEDSKTSLVREINEELGLNVDVTRLLWTTENFFTYNEREFHEIGFYYLVTSKKNSTLSIQKEPFYGEEGERLIFQWVSVDDLKNYVIHPKFLTESIQDLPTSPVHLIIGR